MVKLENCISRPQAFLKEAAVKGSRLITLITQASMPEGTSGDAYYLIS
jgi:hypothetical protein